jgi:DNA-binding response OmpR family regulator
LRDIDKSKLKKIILVHGDSEAQTALKAFLETNGYNVQIAVAEKPIALN